MSFDCCSRYQICINEDQELRKECSYRKKLEKDTRFFISNEPDLEGSFIMLKNRAYFMGKRSEYGWWNYRLTEDEMNNLQKRFLNSSVVVTSKVSLKNCVKERTTDQDKAICRVILTINEAKYTIMNYDTYALREETALGIRNFFRLRNFPAAVEYLGSKLAASSVIQSKKMTGKKIIGQNLSTNQNTDSKENIQCSVFDMNLDFFLRG